MVRLLWVLNILGPRGNGKSSNINRVLNQLHSEYCFLFSTMCSFTSVDSFWKTFGEQLERRNPFVRIPKISSANDFDKFLDASNKEKIFGNKKVLIFVDEFDLLYYSKDESVINGV